MTVTYTTVSIEAMTHDHWTALRRIYADDMATCNAAFETETPG